MIQKFIERPVLSTVISISLIILGIVGLTFLPINQYPDIAPPTIEISASYPGASSTVVQESVIAPIEKQVNGVEGMTYMVSKADNNGNATISIYFEQGVDPDVASTMVQSLVEGAKPSLPTEVLNQGVLTKKVQASMVLVGSISATDSLYDEAFLQNYANINILPKLQRISGVGKVDLFSMHDYSMRVWLDPQKMSVYGVTPMEVAAVISSQNLEAAPGILGQNSNQELEYVLKYKGRGREEVNYEELVVKTGKNGTILKLKDIAEIELASFSHIMSGKVAGFPGVGYAVYQTAGSNSRELVTGLKGVIEDMKDDFPKGITYDYFVDSNEFLDASIAKVINTLLEAFLIVFIVVLIFLHDLRSTIIPAIAVPVSIIGTFFFLNVLGYSINILTLFALVLAIGIVVDDAIVVVEAVHAKMQEGEHNVKKATVSAMNEITGAIISITLVMSAVFLPVTLFGGSTGVFFKQFGMTLFISILISGVNALTLSPVLCVMLLKSHTGPQEGKKKTFAQKYAKVFNGGFDTLTNHYTKLTKWFVNRQYISLGVLIGFIYLISVMIKIVPTGFIPNEDQGKIFVEVNLTPGATRERTNDKAEEIARLIESLPETHAVMNITGFGLVSGQGASHATLFVTLKNWSERTESGQDVTSIIAKLYGMMDSVKDANVMIFSPPTVSGFGVSGGFEFELQDKYGGDYSTFNENATKFLKELNERPEIQYARTSFSMEYPQIMVDVDPALCSKLGVSVSEVLSILQGYIGSMYVSTFNKFGLEYKVMLQAKPEDRAKIDDLDKMYVKNNQGTMIPISQFIKLTKTTGPESVRRFNMYNSIYITGSPSEGHSTGDAIKAIDAVAENLDSNYTYEYSGLAREQLLSQNTTTTILIICIIFIYLILAAQYESYLLPLSVMFSLVFGMFGSLVSVWAFGQENNIYFQLALLMLIGLLAKNAILIVEFAKQRRESGLSIKDAAIDGARSRLRPILMTSFAFIFGLLPLALSQGVNSAGNQSIGISAIGGMLIGTIIGVIMIPSLYVIFQKLQERITKPKEIE